VWTGSLIADTTQNLLRNPRELKVARPANDADQWFTLEVICVGAKITICVNGEKTAEWTDPNPKSLSKQGAIALSVSGAEAVVHFRKVEIKEMKR
jgi:hypothetical protein